MGKAIVDELKTEFIIDDRWIGYQTHPEIPLKGIPLSDKFIDAEKTLGRWQKMFEPYGIRVGRIKKLPNTRMALMASEYARDAGRFRELHEQLFLYYFRDGKDIGDIDIILQAGDSAGLDGRMLGRVLIEGCYHERIALARKEAQECGVVGAPTFIINDRYTILGCQSLDIFRRLILKFTSPR